MLKCFVCKNLFDDPQKLFKHIKKNHKGSERYQCTEQTCNGMMFSDFSNFQKHVKRCFQKRQPNDDMDEQIIPPELFSYAIDERVLQFGTELRKKALEFVLSLCANMNTPRCEVYSVINEMEAVYLTKLIEGIKEIFLPYIRSQAEDNVNDFIKVIESSFSHVKSETLLDNELTELKFYTPLTECALIKVVDKKQKKSRKIQKKNDGERNQVLETDGRRPNPKKRTYESEDDSDENIQAEHEADNECVIVKGNVTLMPIIFQIKAFLELPNVFEKIMTNTEKIQQSADLNHFINGKLWREKLKNYKADDIVIPFHFYGDAAQINNPLGPHVKPGQIQFNYYAFPTIPSQYQSRLQNIFVGQIYEAKLHQEFSNEEIYNNIIQTFETLANDGILISVNGEERKVFFVLGTFIGDNKEQNERLGYVKSHVGKHCCRYCKTDLDGIRTNVNSDGAIRRNRENYDEDVVTDNVTETGIAEYSPFNRIPHFHVTESSAVDLAHDITEGDLHIALGRSIDHFLKKKYFTLDYLNEQLKSIEFGKAEKGNKPVNILKDHISSARFKMTSSEMFFFAHHFTLLVGSVVPDDDPVWQHVLTTIRFFDLCYLPSYNRNQFIALRDASENFNRGLKNLFGETLKHKAHLATHYDVLTEDFGPLRYTQTIRFEGKHKEMKNYAKNTNSRRNPSYSLGKKWQYQFALSLLRCNSLDDRIHIPGYVKDAVKNKVYYSRLTACTKLNEIESNECFFTKEITVNGIIFSPELWLPIFVDGNCKIYEIIEVLLLDTKDISKIYVVCKSYSATYNNHFECYSVNDASLEDNLTILKVEDYLSEHQYPVKIHDVNNLHLFRCKRF